MPNSEVPRIELNGDGTITLYVAVGGFDADTPVDISGYAIQTNGAIATFRVTEIIRANGGKNPIVVIQDVPVIGADGFNTEKPIMAVARAEYSWITKLPSDKNGNELSKEIMEAKQLAGQINIKAAWNSDEKIYHSLARADFPPPDEGLLRHGSGWDRVVPEPPDAATGRYTRLFRYLPGARFDHADLKRLAEEMIAPPEPESAAPEAGPDPEENPGIPTAYTYLGQFVDHDLTFDPTSRLREPLTGLQSLVDLRTPRFDLDNLYGRGPDDQPYMYENDGIRLLLGKPLAGNPFDPAAVQLPRGPNRRALIGDPRNDENRIVAQLHAIFLRFHNRVAYELGGKKHVSFAEVRQQVRWHYQWVLVNDFLRVILDERTYRSVFPDPHGCVLTIPGLRDDRLGLMPVEFSVAAYRFGHSMIRPRYRLNTDIERPIFSSARDDAADLGGFRPIPAGWAIDWQFFIDVDHGAGPAAAGPAPDQVVREPQLSYKIDTALASPLGQLPAQVAADPSSLALRNLERGAAFQLPSGQKVAEALGLQPIADEELVIGKATADDPGKPITQIARCFAGNAPLWAYILSEAQVTSWLNAAPGAARDAIPIRLGPVGGRLVAEVFAALLLGDPTSYLHAEPAFVPIAKFTHGGTFGLAELINVALGHAP